MVLPSFDHFLGGLGVLGELLAGVAGKLGPLQLHGQVVHDLLVHGYRHLGSTLTRKERVRPSVHHLAFQQPPVEGILGRIDG